MWKLKLVFQNKKGFTLFELVLGMAIMSILFLTLYSCLSFTLKLNQKSVAEDEILLNGRYILEYIKDEITSADKIINSSYFLDLDSKFPGNIGFVILNKTISPINKDPTKKKYDVYSYTSYYLENGTMIRINAKRDVEKDVLLSTEKTIKNFPGADEFRGYNKMAYDLLNSSKISLKENNIISFDLFFKNKNSQITSFKSDIFVRCKVVN